MLHIILFQFFIPTGAKKGRSLLTEVDDLKEFKKLLRTKTNLLVVFAKSGIKRCYFKLFYVQYSIKSINWCNSSSIHQENYNFISFIKLFIVKPPWTVTSLQQSSLNNSYFKFPHILSTYHTGHLQTLAYSQHIGFLWLWYTFKGQS